MKKCIACLWLLFLMAGTVMAEDLEILRQRAQNGEAEAMYLLGFMYLDGEGVTQDLAQTEALWLKAAEQDFELAAYSLGSFYLHGYGGAPDYKKAVQWYEKAYDLGSVDAGYDLGVMYQNGIGVTKTPTLAQIWLKNAAERGNVNAKSALGAMYYNGDGVKVDYDKAYACLKDVEAYEHAESQYYLGNLYRIGLNAPKDENRARECYESAAMQNYGPAQYELGHMYYLAQGVETKDIVKAYAWYSHAADNAVEKAREMADYCEKEMTQDEMGRAQIMLARAYYFGYGAAKDDVKALGHLYLAGKFGEDVSAMTAEVVRQLSEEDIFMAESWAQNWLDERGQLKVNQ